MQPEATSHKPEAEGARSQQKKQENTTPKRLASFQPSAKVKHIPVFEDHIQAGSKSPKLIPRPLHKDNYIISIVHMRNIKALMRWNTSHTQVWPNSQHGAQQQDGSEPWKNHK